VRHIPTAQSPRAKWANARTNRRAACEHPEVSDRFVLFNDDMYVMRPIAAVPVLHRGPVDAVIRLFERRGASSAYLAGMRGTAAWLREAGCADPLSYELHVPMPVTKERLLAVLHLAGGVGFPVPHVRTLYGNLYGSRGRVAQDVKITDLNVIPAARATFVSTTDRVFETGEAGRWVRQRLTSPCRYERHEFEAVA
jgi:hypothetical protein